MLRLYACIRDQHDWRLIGLAVLICAVTSLAAVLTLRQVTTPASPVSRRWIGAAGISTGFGIWATHFVAVLGYQPGMIVGYDLAITLASLVIAVVATVCGFAIAFSRRTSLAVGGAALSVGGGIAAMHYAGMTAVELPGSFAWSPAFVIGSVCVAILLSGPAIALTTRARGLLSGLLAGICLTLAILSLHFTGMAAVTILPSALDPSGVLISPIGMAIVIGAVALTTLALSAGAALLNRAAQAAITAKEREFRILVQGITDCALYMLDANGRVVSWNAGAEKLKGYTTREAIGLPLETFYAPADRSAGVPARALEQALREGKFAAAGWRHRKDGTRFWAHVSIEPVRDDSGAFRGFAKITRDMSRLKEDQDQVASLTANLDAALANMHQGLCLFDADQRLVLSNRRFHEIYGTTPEQLPAGTGFREMLHISLHAKTGQAIDEARIDVAVERLRSCLAEPSGGTMTIPYEDGTVVDVSHRRLPDGGWVATYEDVSERRRAEAKIAHMALHDDLTGLPNRSFFNQRLDQELNEAERLGRRVGVIAIDLDRFKEVNDTRGHGAGDFVLQALGRRLADSVGANGFIARFGGDEFAAFMTFDHSDELAAFAHDLEKQLSQPIEYGGIAVPGGASLGVAIYPVDGVRREQLYNNADLAMYRAKSSPGLHICFYQYGMDEAERMRRSLGHDLRQAIARDQFAIAYQVQRCVVTGAIGGYEALLRWHHPQDGWISPAKFIAIAESSDHILAIGEWVLYQACREAAGWAQPHKVAVNLSSIQITNADLVGLVTRALRDSGLPASRLELEITETAIISDKRQALDVLRAIKALGVTIALDDFGTGYSSLDTLSSFPFDKIKIDQSFLPKSDGDKQARAIIRAVLALGRSLDIPVLAEGVETEEQLRMLCAEGCDLAQGYLLGRPEIGVPTFAERDSPLRPATPLRKRSALLNARTDGNLR